METPLKPRSANSLAAAASSADRRDALARLRPVARPAGWLLSVVAVRLVVPFAALAAEGAATALLSAPVYLGRL
jgi:hypothetical protein